jgi:hypothetical protein
MLQERDRQEHQRQAEARTEDGFEQAPVFEAVECMRDVLYLQQEVLGVPQRTGLEDYPVFWGKRLVEATALPGVAGVQSPPIVTLLNYTVEELQGIPMGHYENMRNWRPWE